MTYGESSGVRRLVQGHTTAVWAGEKTALCWNSFLPRPVLHRQPDYNPGSSLCPWGSGSDSCPGWKPLPGGLPKRQGHTHLSHHSLRLGLDMKRKYGKACMATSPRTIPSPNSWRLHPQSRLAKGGGLKIQRVGDLILCNSATVFGGVMWQIMVPRKISHACFPSESMDPKVKWRNEEWNRIWWSGREDN